MSQDALSLHAVEDFIEITHEKLSVDHLIDLVTMPQCGAVSVFLGITRNNFQGKIVKTLEYECYNEMAKKELLKICIELRSKWDDIGKTAISHRLGLVPVSEASVIIAISSPHRKTAIAAVACCIDRLKASVPIWKKEIYENEESEWKENKECFWTANT